MFRLICATFFGLQVLAACAAADESVQVGIFEGTSLEQPWITDEDPAVAWSQPIFAWTQLPKKYIRGGLIADWSNPFTLRATATIDLPAGRYELLLRAKNLARLRVDGETVLEQPQRIAKNQDSHEATPALAPAISVGHRPPPSIHHELTSSIELGEGVHEFQLEAAVGGPSLRTEIGELCVAIAGETDDVFKILAPDQEVEYLLTDEDWNAWVRREQRRVGRLDTTNRRAKIDEDADFWRKRHELARRYYEDSRVSPPPVTDQACVSNDVDRFIVHELERLTLVPAPLTHDLAFLRRVFLDTVGQIPSVAEIEAFTGDERPDRRARLIDQLLDDPRWADHWVPYWQDVLAENPNILKASLNNTGPFRWWIHESFFDNKPMDQFATDLIVMRGSRYNGGPAGFELATQNDVPEANKALILSQAFLATNLKCARCHDSPHNEFTQKQLFSIAAMLRREALELPRTSTVVLEGVARKPLIEVSLKSGDLILPHWPLASLASDAISAEMVQDAADSRQWLAAIVTSARNPRFARVIVNRLWHRYMGRGLVEPIDDWHAAEPSHPQLLDYLARELVMHEYDLKHVARLILNSQTYQREVLAEDTDQRRQREQWFASATRRRMTAEQVFDSLFGIAGKATHAETLTMDPEGRRPIKTFLNLGTPQRAWQFSSLSNERDRPALSLPVAQSANDLLKAFGWRESRQDAVTVRDETITPLQPLVLANGTMGRRVVGLSDDHAVTELCLYDVPLDEIVDRLFLSFYTRKPDEAESQWVAEQLREGFAERRVPDAEPIRDAYAWQRHPVSWSNHLHATSSEIMMKLEQRARAGDPPTPRLTRDWRERMEDVLWALANSTEFVFLP